jgi:putative SOS response-associated peptidase YedK
MCGRYTLTKTGGLQKRFSTSNKLAFEESYNVSPGGQLPVITRYSPNKIMMMRWGFVPDWGKEKKFSFINIRKESTLDKPYFRKVLTTSRCLVPADGFYEWRTVDLEGKEEKYPFYIYVIGRKLFGFAGLYSKLLDAEEKEHYYFAILTCSPNKLVGKVHNRMPVILAKKDENSWLNNKNTNFEDLHNLLKPFPAEEMKIYPVSRAVNNPRNDDETLIRQVKDKS